MPCGKPNAWMRQWPQCCRRMVALFRTCACPVEVYSRSRPLKSAALTRHSSARRRSAACKAMSPSCFQRAYWTRGRQDMGRISARKHGPEAEGGDGYPLE
eukprot:scaffold275491_cov28-Tisochrysis_lutea.AAC.3